MFADVKNLIRIDGIVYKYKSDRILDLSLKGHPALIICVTDKHFYYLTISSSVKNALHIEDRTQFILERDKHNKLKAPLSYVNLRNIYKEDLKNYVATGYVKNDKFNEIINALKFYQENVQEDEYYSEIRGYLANLINTQHR